MAKETQHTTLYRRYRPQDWNEVRGQEQVTGVLEKAIKNGKTAHAYLFCGSRGTGKTSVARILARKLGVTEKDLYEMDAASRTGVDDIRELREGVNTVPFESPYKFYIIDEAHMLSKIVTDVAKKEGYALERSAAELVALLAEGSFRDALSILQKVLAVSKD